MNTVLDRNNAGMGYRVTHLQDRLIRIERDVPMPDFQRAYKYPWKEMLVGDSFLVPNKSKATFSAYCRDKGKKLNREFRCRDEDGGVRVWRMG